MDQENIAGESIWGTREISEMPSQVRMYALELLQSQESGSAWSAPREEHSLDKIMEALVIAYITTNMKFKGIPLKALFAEFEKNIILASLRLTNGNQKDAAALLLLKPTALFEKLRKHGISGKQVKFTQQLYGASAERLANAAMG